MHNRMIGKTHAMVLSIKATLDIGEKAAILGCKDPQPILARLKKLGINAKAEPMIATQPLKPIYSTDGYEERVIGLTGGEKKHTGHIFYCP